MTAITTRTAKGSALTYAELDNNFKIPVQAKTSNYTTVATDNRSVIEASTNITITLGDASDMVAAEDTGDYLLTVFNAGTSVVLVAPSGADNINGANVSIPLSPQKSATFIANAAGDGYMMLLLDNNYEKYKTADESTNTDTTLTDDTHLAGYVLAPDTVYTIEGWFRFNGNSPNGIKWGMQVDQTPQDSWWRINNTSSTEGELIATSPTGGVIAAPDDASYGVDGFIHTHATAITTMDLQWAQDISDASNVTMYKGSWLRVRPLGTA